MNLKRRAKTGQSIAELFKTYFSNGTYSDASDLDFLVHLVHFFRPRKPKEERVSLKDLIAFLEQRPIEKRLFMQYVGNVFSGRKFSRMLSDAGILQDSDFIYEVKKRLFAKVLPFQPEQDTLEYVLNQVFFLDTDTIWVNRISKDELYRLFDLLQCSDLFASAKEGTPVSEVLNAMAILSQRMSGRAI